MAKRQETLELENALIEDTKEKRIYGCEEITIGFYNNGHGNEVVDFMTMNSKGIIKCYEIKVTLQDLKSDAKKSWYGHYNYLVVTDELYDSINDWNEFVPKYVGIISGSSLPIVKRAQKQIIDKDTEIMLKESLVRSMYFKMIKYRNANNLENQKQLTSKIRKLEKERDSYSNRALKAEKIINKYETYKSYNDGIDIDLEAMGNEECSKYRSCKDRKEQMLNNLKNQ